MATGRNPVPSSSVEVEYSKPGLLVQLNFGGSKNTHETVHIFYCVCCISLSDCRLLHFFFASLLTPPVPREESVLSSYQPIYFSPGTRLTVCNRGSDHDQQRFLTASTLVYETHFETDSCRYLVMTLSTAEIEFVLMINK